MGKSLSNQAKGNSFGKTEKKDLGLADQRRACSLLLESLLPLLADPIMGAEPIIPIFYAVKPSTLRDAVDGKGTFDASLRTLEGETITDCHTRLPKSRYDTETINKWRKALSQVADLKGLEIKYVAPEAYNKSEPLILQARCSFYFSKVICNWCF